MWKKWDPIEYCFYSTLILFLNWSEDGRLRPKYVDKYNLIVIIASCLDVCCVLTVHNILYKNVYNVTEFEFLSDLSLSTHLRISLDLYGSNYRTHQDKIC